MGDDDVDRFDCSLGEKVKWGEGGGMSKIGTFMRKKTPKSTLLGDGGMLFLNQEANREIKKKGGGGIGIRGI